MNDRFAPIFHASPLAHPAPTCIPAPRPQILDEARVQPDYLAMDDVSEYAQTMPRSQRLGTIGSHRAMSASYEPDEDEQSLFEGRVEPVSEPARPTPNGKYVGLAMDACAALFEIVQSCRVPANYDVFSEVDVDKWAAICARAGYRL